MWRPIFIIILFVIVLLRELNCVKTPQCDANKSVNRLDIYAPKVELYHLQSSTWLARVHIIYIHQRLRCLFHLATRTTIF
jgi:hypothetical protein